MTDDNQRNVIANLYILSTIFRFIQCFLCNRCRTINCIVTTQTMIEDVEALTTRKRSKLFKYYKFLENILLPFYVKFFLTVINAPVTIIRVNDGYIFYTLISYQCESR